MALATGSVNGRPSALSFAHRRWFGLRELTIATETLFEGRLLKLRRDLVRLPDGRESVREIVVHPGAVAIVPMRDDGQVILVRQYRHATGKVLLEVPAGTLNPNEAPEDCALRELREETGYTATHLERLVSFYLAPGYSTELIHLFLATGLKPADGKTDEDEWVETVVMPLAEAVAQILRGEIEDAKTMAALLLVWQKVNEPSP
jgi:ADP-ribose pyrophosphatase